MNIDRHWSLDKKMSLSLVIVIVIFFIISIWSFSTLTGTVQNNHIVQNTANKSLESKINIKIKNLENNIENLTDKLNMKINNVENKLYILNKDKFTKIEALEGMKVLQVQITNNNTKLIDTNKKIHNVFIHISEKLDRLIEKNLIKNPP